MDAQKSLNIATLVPLFKNQIILNRFDHLVEGQAFSILNNCDPQPIYYRLLVERGPVFNWKYLEKGPQQWKVEIKKLKNNENDLQIGEIVAKDYRKADVFRRYGIDFYCGGRKTLEKACENKKIDIEEIKEALKEVEKTPLPSAIDYNKWHLSFLMNYIVNTHHRYVTEVDPEIHEFMQKVAEVYAEKHYEIIDIARSFIKTSSELKQHLLREKTILYPYINKLIKAKNEQTELPQLSFGSVTQLIRKLEIEHNNMHYEMKEVEFISNNFTLPEDADIIFSNAYTKLKLFLDELLLHIHLENNILFPKCIALEKELMKNSKVDSMP